MDLFLLLPVFVFSRFTFPLFKRVQHVLQNKSRIILTHHSASSFDMWKSFPCSCEGKKTSSVSPPPSSLERWILGEGVGWNTGQSLSSSSSWLALSALFPFKSVGPTGPVKWLSKLKMTVPGLWTWTGPKKTKKHIGDHLVLKHFIIFYEFMRVKKFIWKDLFHSAVPRLASERGDVCCFAVSLGNWWVDSFALQLPFCPS